MHTPECHVALLVASANPSMRYALALPVLVGLLAVLVPTTRNALVVHSTRALQAVFSRYFTIEERSDSDADAAFVFGYDIGDGPPTLSPTLVHRLSLALELCKAGRVRALLLSGGIPEGKHASEAEAMHQWLLENGLEGTQCRDVVLEKESTSTRTNVALSARELHARGWTRLYLVTSPYHEWRAVRSMQALGEYSNVSTLLPPHELAQVPHHDLGLREGVRELLAIALYSAIGWVSLF